MKDIGKESTGVTVESETLDGGLARKSMDFKKNRIEKQMKRIKFWGEVYDKHERLHGNILLLKAIHETIHGVK